MTQTDTPPDILPGAVVLEGAEDVPPTPPSLVIPVQVGEAISSLPSGGGVALDSTDLDRLRISAGLGLHLADLSRLGDSDADALERLRLAVQIRDALAALGVQPEEESDDPNSPNYRYRDTGYIAASRKERAAEMIRVARDSGQMLRATDVDWSEIEQNPRQAKELITKSNLFGKVDWAALREAGMDPAAGFLIDRVYASIAPEPAEDKPQARMDYARGIETIRARIEDCLTVDAVMAVLQEIRDELRGTTLRPDEAEQYELWRAELIEVRIKLRDAENSTNSLYEAAQAAKSEQYRVEYTLEGRKKRGWKIQPEHEEALANAQALAEQLWAQWSSALDAKRPIVESLRNQAQALSRQLIDLEQAAKARNLTENPVTRAWLTFGDRFFKLLHYRSFKGSDAFAGHVTNAKAGRIADWAWSEEKDRPLRTATKQEINFQLRVADTYTRRGGRAVSAASTQALKDALGLRDVQSGNWVLKDPNSAKFHVEQTAAAMSDLADVLGIDGNALGLGGRLGLAFGARGTGGKNTARAHYEPVHRVINLTKMGGGGCLGHEFFHAVDNMLAELVTQQSTGKGDFATSNPDLLPDGPIKEATKALVGAIYQGDNRVTESIKFTEKDVRIAKYNVDSPSSNMARAIKEAGNATDAVLAVDSSVENTRSKGSTYHRRWRTLAAAYYAPEGVNIIRTKTGRLVSNFVVGAGQLDNGEIGKYWSQTDELAARAFQSWIEDRLTEQDRQNDYLSVYADNKYHVDPLTGFEWKPYPEGDERAQINAAFDGLFAAIREAKTFESAAVNPTLLDAIFGATQQVDAGAEPDLLPV
ncbi:Phage protein [Cupriavidus basilensis]|uniref:Phage protein n=2 Tax=Cupriavidus basilensis TaxID=68895 RepID=A0A0C4YDK1_9BURK|nr:Phage protein [Cupriavidus basilensis]